MAKKKTKKSQNEILYDAAIDAINELHSDLSVSQEECLNNLNGLVDEIKIKIEAMENDLSHLSE